MKNLATKIQLILVLPILLLSGSALAQSQDFSFHWAPGATIGDGDIPLPAAVEYDVFLKRGSGAEEKIATVFMDTTYVLSAEPGIVQRIRVCGIDANGRESVMSEWSDPIYFEGERGEGPPPAPELGGNYPNPFNPETRISYGVPIDLDDGTPMSLEIYNLQGMLVRTLDVERSPGWHNVVWDGTSNQGQTVSTGLYLTRYSCGSTVETNKMTLLK